MPDLEQAVKAAHLAIFAALHTRPEDGLGTGTLFLLGPEEPGFWPLVSTSPEFADGERDPLDRWSARVVDGLARDVGGRALFPFGEPRHPFIGWALRSGHCFSSPALLLVHETAGLFVSFRGAILLPEAIDLPPAPANPCLSCAGKPCLTACPPKALREGQYDLPACHDFLDTEPGESCMSGGCAVRRACPLSQSYPRLGEQSAFHMREFHR